MAIVGIGQKLGIGSNSGPLEIIGLSPPNRQVPTEEGVEVFRVYFGEKYQRDVYFKPEFTMELAVEQVRTVTRPPLLPMLRGARDDIAAIIQSFHTEFASVGA